MSWVEPGAGRRIIDLTVELAESLPCSWPTHLPYQHHVYNYYADVGGRDPRSARLGAYQTRWLAIDEHTGTHLDAPAHFIPEPDSGLPNAAGAGTVTVEQLPLEGLFGAAVVIDVRHLREGPVQDGVSPAITPATIEAFEAEHGRLEPSEIVLFRSDWADLYGPGADGDAYGRAPVVEGKGPGWPAPDAAAIEMLDQRGIVTLGTEAPSVGATEDGAPAHLAGLGRRMIFIEGLTGLRELPTRGATFLMLPLKIKNGTGAPGRAIAFVS
ncbi:MAG: cyclase family protein [Actinobacteria bacterium]|nr:cyclase family protein [Actinomycetota bacterium]